MREDVVSASVDITLCFPRARWQGAVLGARAVSGSTPSCACAARPPGPAAWWGQLRLSRHLNLEFPEPLVDLKCSMCLRIIEKEAETVKSAVKMK